MTRELICPKCGSGYEQHPLDPASQTLCPSCRNKVSWDDIQRELAAAAKLRKEFVAGQTRPEPARARA